ERVACDRTAAGNDDVHSDETYVNGDDVNVVTVTGCNGCRYCCTKLPPPWNFASLPTCTSPSNVCVVAAVHVKLLPVQIDPATRVALPSSCRSFPVEIDA